MANDKLIAINMDDHSFLCSLKLIPREPVGDCLKKVLAEYKELKSRGEFEKLTPEEKKVVEEKLELEREERFEKSEAKEKALADAEDSSSGE